MLKLLIPVYIKETILQNKQLIFNNNQLKRKPLFKGSIGRGMKIYFPG